MADGKDPLRQLIEVAVYAPIGLALLAKAELPNLVAAGKTQVDNQVTLARFVGKMAVKKGRQQLQRHLDAAAAARTAAPVASSTEVPDLLAPELVAVEEAARDRLVATLPDAIITAVAAATESSESTDSASAGALPIDGYDSLAASQVVTRLATLTPSELDTIRAHEESHRARRTILGKINQLQVL